MVGHKDEAGAGAEGGEALGDALAQRFEHSQVMQQLRLYVGLAAGSTRPSKGRARSAAWRSSMVVQPRIAGAARAR